MSQQPIRFTDGAAYERGMGPWSQLVGEVFLDWLAPPAGAEGRITYEVRANAIKGRVPKAA